MSYVGIKGTNVFRIDAVGIQILGVSAMETFVGVSAIPEEKTVFFAAPLRNMHVAFWSYKELREF